MIKMNNQNNDKNIKEKFDEDEIQKSDFDTFFLFVGASAARTYQLAQH